MSLELWQLVTTLYTSSPYRNLFASSIFTCMNQTLCHLFVLKKLSYYVYKLPGLAKAWPTTSFQSGMNLLHCRTNFSLKTRKGVFLCCSQSFRETVSFFSNTELHTQWVNLLWTPPKLSLAFLKAWEVPRQKAWYCLEINQPEPQTLLPGTFWLKRKGALPVTSG